MSNNASLRFDWRDHSHPFRTKKISYRNLRQSSDWPKICAILVFVVMTSTLPVSRAAAVPVRPSSKLILAPYVQCDTSVCDLRSHYCDEVIQACARCDDDCHPSRITGVPSAITECQKKCQWYYVFKSIAPPSTTLPSNPAPSALEVQFQHEDPYEPGNTTVMLTVVLCMTVIIILALLVAIVIPVVVCYLHRHRTGFSRITTDSCLNSQSKANSSVMVTNHTTEPPKTTTHVKVSEARAEGDESMPPSAPISMNSGRVSLEPESLALLLSSRQECRS